MMKSGKLAVLSVLFVSVLSVKGFADEVCDKYCLQKVVSQILTLRAELKNAIPIGTILPYSGADAMPSGFVPCDGSSLDRVKYDKLFGVIRLTYTPEAEHSGTNFRLPNLNGRTLVGTGQANAGGATHELGSTGGLEMGTLSIANIPAHIHKGTTGDNDANHSHGGTVDPDNTPAHSHTYARGVEKTVRIGGTYGAQPAANLGQPNVGNAPAPGHEALETLTASTRHQHKFTTSLETNGHKHPFETDNGALYGLSGTPFSLMQPFLAVRYMVKAE